MKKTRIIATYGPSIASKERIRGLVSAGVNLFRINCSHGARDDFLKAAGLIREAASGEGFPVGLLFDLSGPKLRVARFQGELPVEAGGKLFLTPRRTDLKAHEVGVNHPAVIRGLKKGDRVFMDDGNLIFEVLSASRDRVAVRALRSGILLPAKGINLPDTEIGTPAITVKDRKDITAAVEADADYIGLSFVRSARDIRQARRLIQRAGGRQKVIAKLEKREAIDRLEEIMTSSDGVMVARGDLGVELDPAELPSLQKRIIRLARGLRKPVIVATQMLESMRFSPRATRAEINDVASAVFDHADAVMLSAETATGGYPVEAVGTMARVIEAAEPNAQRPSMEAGEPGTGMGVPLAIAEAVSRADAPCDIKAILAFTASGFTAELISNLYPDQPIIALTPDREVMRQLVLHRSVYPVLSPHSDSFEGLIAIVKDVCARFDLARRGEHVIITGGAPLGAVLPTNFMMIHEL